METKFIKEFIKLFKKNDWITDNEYKKVYHFFSIEQENNEKFLIEKLNEYSIEKGDEFILRFYTVTGFIKFLGKKDSFTNPEIIKKLKDILSYILKQEKLEKKYSYTLNILFSINKEDKNYYSKQFDLLNKENKLYHDINRTFFTIFIDLKINDRFIIALQKSIIHNATEMYYFSVKEGFNYLISLDNDNFKKYFLELLEFFDLKENKKKLILFDEYNGLTEAYDEKIFKKVFEDLVKKIDNSNYTKEELDTIKVFIIGDIDFAIDHYQIDILNNIFINELFKFFYEKNSDFLIEVLSKIKSKHIFSIQSLIVQYLQKNQIEDLIKLYKNTDNSNILFFTYDILKQSGKNDIIKSFEDSSIGKDIIKRNKGIEKNNKKFEKEKEENLKKEKEEFLKMLNPKKGHYYPKLLQDYQRYISDKEGLLEKTFSKEEIKKINTSIKKQIENYLGVINIKSYKDERIPKIITFEKTGENSYSHTWNSVYLGWIIDIAKNINFDLDNYYKIFVLFYPLFWGEEKIKDDLEIISKNLKKDDIDYILRVFSEDLHENAIGLRYYHIDTLNDFYNKFKDRFSLKQKNKLEGICLDLINRNEENNIYSKEGFLKTYSEIGGEKKVLKLWKQWKSNFPYFNYFKDVLEENDINKEEKEKMKFLLFICKELINTYKNKEMVLWSIEQVKNGKIEAVDTHKIKYPYVSASFSGLSEKESELGRGGSDQHNFSYIFEIIPDIDVLKEFLELLDYSFSIQADLISGKTKGDYELYCFYIRNLFYKYIKNLDPNLVNKDYYYKIKELLNKYNYKITYSFNLFKIKEKFGIDDIEEEAKEIIEKDGLDGVIKLLKESEKDIGLNISNFIGNEEITKYKEIIKLLEEKNKKLLKDREKYNDYDSSMKRNLENIDKIKKLVKEKGKLNNDLNELNTLNKELEEKNTNLTELLNIKNINFIIIVEGEADKILLETFFDNKSLKPFIIIGGNSYGVFLLLKNYKNKSFSIPIIGIFDFDYNGVKEYCNLDEEKGFIKIEKTHYEGRLKKHKDSNVYGLLLPVPNNDIKKQVIKKELKPKSISGLPNNSNYEIVRSALSRCFQME